MRQAALVLALAVVLPLAHAEDVKAKLQPIYDRFSALTKKKDVSGLEKLWGQIGGKGFVYEVNGQKQTADQMFGQMKAQISQVTKVQSIEQKIAKVKLSGDHADLTVNAVWVMVLNLDGKKHTIKGVESTLDTWTKVGGQWRLTHMKAIKSTQTENGKPVGG